MLEKTIKSTPKKKLGICSPVFCTFFIHPQPNIIGPVRQQHRDWGSFFNFSGRGRGVQLLLISFATTRLHGICNGSINGMEDGGHTLQPHSLGTGDMCPPPPHPPKISEFFLFGTGRGHKSVLFSATRLEEI